ncbi:MAG: glycine oxidase ThiO [Spirulinaceae cyanobacterium]
MVKGISSRGEVIIVGGGVIGLSIAIELKLRGVGVTVLSRSFQEATGHVAAGMLAPQAEQIPPSPMLELCDSSLSMYKDWTRKLESITGLDTGYWNCGILAPIYQEDSPVNTLQTDSSSRQWLNQEAISQHQPNLGADVVGGWWYPQNGQVDNRRALMKVLRVAAQELGINWHEGVEVKEILNSPRKEVVALKTNQGLIQGSHYILATGAWSQQLLPMPIYPKKGQMLSVKVPPGKEKLPLKQVLFGQQIYIVPRRDGLIVIGATSENVGFTPHNTPSGIQQLLTQAIRLYPPLENFPIQEFWWGYRPATPDELPILGTSPWPNLTLATGHYRNGILLAPITASLIADLVWEQKIDPLLTNFRWDRFEIGDCVDFP